MKKNKYEAPTVELFPMESTATLCGSFIEGGSDAPGYGNGGSFGAAASGRAGYGTGTNYSASSSDLEEMINDILTY
jgi:hypothetical protein